MSAEKIIQQMAVWYDGTLAPGKDRRAKDAKSRAEHQKDWDSGVMAAAELARRLTGDESLALKIHGLLSIELPKGAGEEE